VGWGGTAVRAQGIAGCWVAEIRPFHWAGVWPTDVPARLQLGRCRQDHGCLGMDNVNLRRAPALNSRVMGTHDECWVRRPHLVGSVGSSEREGGSQPELNSMELRLLRAFQTPTTLAEAT